MISVRKNLTLEFYQKDVQDGLRTRTLCSTRETSQVECGHPGNFLIDVLSKSVQEGVKVQNQDDDPQQGPEQHSADGAPHDRNRNQDGSAFSRARTIQKRGSLPRA